MSTIAVVLITVLVAASVGYCVRRKRRARAVLVNGRRWVRIDGHGEEEGDWGDPWFRRE